MARTDNTKFESCAMTRWSVVVLFGAGTVAYLAAMTTGPIFLAWGVIFAVTLLCLRQIKQGRISFGASPRLLDRATGARVPSWSSRLTCNEWCSNSVSVSSPR